jgi:hypothetical protein
LKQSEHDELFNEVINIEFSNYKSISLWIVNLLLMVMS